ncbi:hypothetical protein M569_12955, partial [Genlisea aurea]
NPTIRVQSIKICVTHLYRVLIASELPPNSGQLKAHCASKDDDLGIHYLDPDQSFLWKFCEDYWRRTLYFCHFWWGQRQISFDAFNSETQGGGRVLNLIGWYAKEDGIYYYDDDSPIPMTKKYDW